MIVDTRVCAVSHLDAFLIGNTEGVAHDGADFQGFLPHLRREEIRLLTGDALDGVAGNQRRHQIGAGLHKQVGHFFIQIGPVLDGIDAGPQRRHHAGLAMRMRSDFATHGVRRFDQGDLFFIGKLLLGAGSGDAQHAAGSHIFDVVGTVFDLRAHGAAAFGDAVTHIGAGFGEDVVAEAVAVTVTAGGRDGTAGGENARPHDDALIDGVAQGEDGITVGADIAHGGKAGAQRTHAELHTHQGAELG